MIEAGVEIQKRVVFYSCGYVVSQEPHVHDHFAFNFIKVVLSFTGDVYTFNSLIEATAMMNEKFEEKWNKILVRKNPHFVF